MCVFLKDKHRDFGAIVGAALALRLEKLSLEPPELSWFQPNRVSLPRDFSAEKKVTGVKKDQKF
jgi:hypothetical protein